MLLIKALRYTIPSTLVFVGAGGKTSAIFHTAHELLAATNEDPLSTTVLVTTTTHLGAWQAKLADHLIFIKTANDFDHFVGNLPGGLVVIAGAESGDRLRGIDPGLLERLHLIAQDRRIPLLIEADGSHMRLLKAPAVHEPAIPGFAQGVVVVAGLHGLAKPLDEHWVHRVENFAQLSGLLPGQIITPAALNKVLLSGDGGLKNIPPGARTIVLLNQVDTAELQEQARIMSVELVSQYHSSIIASIDHRENRSDHEDNTEGFSHGVVHSVVERVGGIILAAGGSSRFGKPKQLLDWRGESLIRHVARTALEAGLSPVVVVVGSSATDVESDIKDLPLRIVINDRWMDGLSTSVRAGIRALPGEAGGAVFLQADQPQIPVELIKGLTEMHQRTLDPIVAPLIVGRRGNPVLFDKTTFPEMASLSGDTGGRVLFERFPVGWVPWDDPNLLLDIDTMDDYQKLLSVYREDQVTR